MNVGDLFARLHLDIDDFRRNLNDAQGQLQSVSDRMKGIGQAMSLAITTPVIGGFVAITEGTRELRQDLGKLDAAFTTSGFTAEQAKDVYREFYGILGESDTAIEASNHLAKLTDNQKELSDWVTIATGVYATFGDSLPIEGLTEAANETAKVGQVTGPLADALNWAAVSEDAFNESLAACTSEQERQALITSTLNGLYEEAATEYRKVNGEVIEANKAHAGLTLSLKDLGDTLDPVLTKIVEGATKLINKFNELDPATQKVIFVLTGITAVIGPLLVVVGTMITSFTSVVGVLTKIPAAITVVKTALLGINPVFATIAATVTAGIYIWQNYGEQIKAAVSNAVEAVKTKFAEMVEAGRNLVAGIISGVSEKAGELKQKVIDLAESIKSAFKSAMSISSPSQVMAEFGRMVSQGLADGISANVSIVEEAANRLAEVITNVADKMVSDLSTAASLTTKEFELLRLQLSVTKTEAELIDAAHEALAVQLGLTKDQVMALTAEYGINKTELSALGLEAEKARLEKQKLAAQLTSLYGQIDVLTEAYNRSVAATGASSSASMALKNRLLELQIQAAQTSAAMVSANNSIASSAEGIISSLGAVESKANAATAAIKRAEAAARNSSVINNDGINEFDEDKLEDKERYFADRKKQRAETEDYMKEIVFVRRGEALKLASRGDTEGAKEWLGYFNESIDRIMAGEGGGYSKNYSKEDAIEDANDYLQGRRFADLADLKKQTNDEVLATLGVPGLAAGGTVLRSGLVRVGEYGPELLSLPRGAQVTPLQGTANVIDYDKLGQTIARYISQAGNTLQVVLDGQVIAKYTVDHLGNVLRQPARALGV